MMGVGAIAGGRGTGAPPSVQLPFNADWSDDSIVAGNATLPMLTQFTTNSADVTTRTQFVTSSPAPRQGSNSLRIECQPGDNPVSSTESNKVSSWVVPRNYFQRGDDVWIATSIMIDSSFTYPGDLGFSINIFQIFFQMWPGLTTGGGAAGNPCITLGVNYRSNDSGYGWLMAVRGGTVAGGSPPRLGGATTRYYYADIASGGPGPVLADTWYDFLIHAVFDDGVVADGSTSWWCRKSTGSFSGPAMAIDVGPNIYTLSGVHYVNYPVVCVYRSGAVKTDVVYFGGVTIGEARSDAETLWT